MTWHLGGRVEEIPPGQTKAVCLEGTPVILANWNGAFYAMYGLCPHRLNPLEGAILWDHLIDCPWHHFQYDIRTGENYFPGNVYPKDYSGLAEQLKPLETYRVELRGSEVWVELK